MGQVITTAGMKHKKMVGRHSKSVENFSEVEFPRMLKTSGVYTPGPTRACAQVNLTCALVNFISFKQHEMPI